MNELIAPALTHKAVTSTLLRNINRPTRRRALITTRRLFVGKRRIFVL